MSVEYHLKELEIARNPADPARLMPPIGPGHRRILDIGCGMGQMLLAAQLPSNSEAYGVDCDREAIEAGRGLAPPNVKLLCASATHLPFRDQYFDLVFSRIALPYVSINEALREISRVLKTDGDVWLALHPASMVVSRLKESVRAGKVKDAAFCGYVLANGVLFNWLGTQTACFGRMESFQTNGGMARAMRRAGLTCRSMRSPGHFVVQGRRMDSLLKGPRGPRDNETAAT